jgi:hypothetical protein
MAEPTTPAVVPAAAPAAAPVAESVPAVVAPSAVELKLDALTAAITGLVGHLSAPAAPVEAAPVAVAPVVEAAPVVESTEQMVARMVQEGIKAGLTSAVQEHVAQNGVQRKGIVVQEHRASGAAGVGPNPWGGPDKPLHEYTSEEVKAFINPYVEQQWMGSRSVIAQNG